MILTEHHLALGSDEGVILVQGGRGTPWNQSTLVEVHEEGVFGEASDGTPMWILTAHQWGPFDVVARVLDSAPTEPDETWEDVTEVSITCEAGLYISELVSEEDGVTLDSAPGAYRVRVSARGRAVDWWEQEQEEPKEWSQRPTVEHYLIEVWPSPAKPPIDLRESSTFARTTRGRA